MSRLIRITLIAGSLMVLTSAAASQAVDKPRSLVSVRGWISDATASPDGKLISYSTSDSIFVIDPATGRSSALLGDYAEIIKWSPTGDRIFATRYNESDDKCYVWSVPVDRGTGAATGDWRRVISSGSRSPFPSPDGKWVAYLQGNCGGPAKLALTPVSGGQERILADNAEYRIGWSPDSKTLYYASPEGRQFALFRLSTEGGPAERIGVVPTPFPGLSNDGRYWFSLANEPKHGRKEVQVFDLAGKLVATSSVPSTTNVRGWMNVGYELLANNGDHAVTMLAVPATGGTARRMFTVNADPQRQVSPSPDGRMIAWAWGTAAGLEVSLSDAQGGNRRVIDTMHTSAFGDVFLEWSPDGRMLAYSTPSDTTLTIVTTQGRRVARAGADVLIAASYWSADSRRLRYVRQDGTPAKRRISVRELGIDGSDREVLDLTAYKEGPLLLFLDFDRLLALRAGLVYRLNGSGDTTRILPAAADAGGWPTRSWDRRVHAYVRGQDRSTVHVMSVATDVAHSRIKLPFTFGQTGLVKMRLDRTGETLFMIRPSTASSPASLYRIPVNGGEPSVIYTAPAGHNIHAIAPSNDGSTIYTTIAAPFVSHFVSVDLGRALRKTAGTR